VSRAVDVAPVLAATAWPTNAHLIADVHRLGYLRDHDQVLDPTYENGVWWKTWRPANLTTHYRKHDGTDFRHLDYPDGAFDAIAYDPPYVCPGGRKTSTIQPMHQRYGMAEGGHDPDFRTPAELQQIVDDGLTEMARLVRPARTRNDGGIIVAKCQNYIWSGHLWPGAELVRDHAVRLGLVVVDRLEMVGAPGPQPTTNPDGTPRRQVHARRNLSTLWVFRRPKPTPTTLDLGASPPLPSDIAEVVG
jgi:hypothetical protein